MQRVDDRFYLLQFLGCRVDPDSPFPPVVTAIHCGVATDAQRLLRCSTWTWIRLSSSSPLTHTNIPPGSAIGSPGCHSERSAPLTERYWKRVPLPSLLATWGGRIFTLTSRP